MVGVNRVDTDETSFHGGEFSVDLLRLGALLLQLAPGLQRRLCFGVIDGALLAPLGPAAAKPFSTVPGNRLDGKKKKGVGTRQR